MLCWCKQTSVLASLRGGQGNEGLDVVMRKGVEQRPTYQTSWRDDDRHTHADRHMYVIEFMVASLSAKFTNYVMMK